MADKVARTYKVRISLVNAPTDIKLGMTASVAGGWFRQSAVGSGVYSAGGRLPDYR